MASIRSLKKLINLELALLIDDCYEVLLTNPDDEQELNEVIDEAVNLFDNLIERVNDFRGEENKQNYFKSIEDDLGNGLAQLRNKLSQLGYN